MHSAISLSNSDLSFLVDADFDPSDRYLIDGYGYARDSKRRLMHRIIMECLDRPDIVVDHINMNRLDNRKCNLRLATIAENNLNRKPRKDKSLPLKNVYLETSGRYRVRVGINKKSTNFGTYLMEDLAITIADLAVIYMHGSFGRTNRPREIYMGRDWASEPSGYFVPNYCVSKEGKRFISTDRPSLAIQLEVSKRTLDRILEVPSLTSVIRRCGADFKYEGVSKKELTMQELLTTLSIKI